MLFMCSLLRTRSTMIVAMIDDAGYPQCTESRCVAVGRPVNKTLHRVCWQKAEQVECQGFKCQNYRLDFLRVECGNRQVFRANLAGDCHPGISAGGISGMRRGCRHGEFERAKKVTLQFSDNGDLFVPETLSSPPSREFCRSILSNASFCIHRTVFVQHGLLPSKE